MREKNRMMLIVMLSMACLLGELWPACTKKA